MVVLGTVASELHGNPLCSRPAWSYQSARHLTSTCEARNCSICASPLCDRLRKIPGGTVFVIHTCGAVVTRSAVVKSSMLDARVLLGACLLVQSAVAQLDLTLVHWGDLHGRCVSGSCRSPASQGSIYLQVRNCVRNTMLDVMSPLPSHGLVPSRVPVFGQCADVEADRRLRGAHSLNHSRILSVYTSLCHTIFASQGVIERG